MIKVRLNEDAVNLLRHKGGFHTSKKGKKGYKRNCEKKVIYKEIRYC